MNPPPGPHSRKIILSGLTRSVAIGLSLLLVSVTLLAGSGAASGTPKGSDLTYASFFGGDGTGLDVVYGLAADSEGAIHVGGVTVSEDFPTTGDGEPGGSDDMNGFVAKFAADGSLVWSTYLGGSNVDQVESVAVDDAGRVWVTGYTRSNDFPVTPDALQPLHGGSDTADAFLARYGPDGVLEYSTFLGGLGWDRAMEIALDQGGNVYVTGVTGSLNFPVAAAFQSLKSLRSDDAFLTKFNPSGEIIYSTFLGGDSSDVGEGLAIGADGSPHLTGITLSSDFPTKEAAQSTPRSPGDAFVTKFTPDGSDLVYSTYFGGGVGDNGQDIDVDDEGNAYVTGLTGSLDFPVTPSAAQTSMGGSFDAFVLKLDPSGNVAYSTYLGGRRSDLGIAVTAGDSGAAFVTGETSSPDFPLATPIQATHRGGDSSGTDAFVTNINQDGTQLSFSTFLGGRGDEQGTHIASSPHDGSLVLGGYSTSPDFPIAGDAFQSSLRGRIDGIVATISSVSGGSRASDVSFTETSATSGQHSDRVRFEARLSDAAGLPIRDAQLTFDLVGAQSSRSFTAATDESGVASTVATLGEEPGSHELIVHYPGDEDHDASSETASFEVMSEDADLTLTVEGRGKTRTLEAYLFDQDDPTSGIADRAIDFYADGEFIGSTTTDGDGIALLETPPRFRGGHHDFEALFKGDPYYLPARASEQDSSTSGGNQAL